MSFSVRLVHWRMLKRHWLCRNWLCYIAIHFLSLWLQLIWLCVCVCVLKLLLGCPPALLTPFNTQHQLTLTPLATQTHTHSTFYSHTSNPCIYNKNWIQSSSGLPAHSRSACSAQLLAFPQFASRGEYKSVWKVSVNDLSDLISFIDSHCHWSAVMIRSFRWHVCLGNRGCKQMWIRHWIGHKSNNSYRVEWT